MGFDPGDGEIRIAILLAAAALTATPAHAQPPRNWPLTPEGYGPARLGMTRNQVQDALDVALQGRPLEPGASCIELVPERGYPDMVFMFLDGRLSRIAVEGASRVATPRGIHVGASAAEVRRAYPTGLQAEEHAYTGAPAEYLTFWTRPNRRGVRFATDENRRVDTIIAGNSSIQYIEGCA